MYVHAGLQFAVIYFLTSCQNFSENIQITLHLDKPLPFR